MHGSSQARHEGPFNSGDCVNVGGRKVGCKRKDSLSAEAAGVGGRSEDRDQRSEISG